MRRARAVLARASVGWLIGCAVLIPSAVAQKISINFDDKADFSRIHRYQWRTHPVFEKNPDLQTVYATGIQLVLEAGNAQLMKRGFQPDDVSPDVFVTFFILTKEAQELKTTVLSGWGPAWGPGYGWYGVPT